jgi:hypothetical protein
MFIIITTLNDVYAAAFRRFSTSSHSPSKDRQAEWRRKPGRSGGVPSMFVLGNQNNYQGSDGIMHTSSPCHYKCAKNVGHSLY